MASKNDILKKWQSEVNGADPMSVFLQGIHLKTGLSLTGIRMTIDSSFVVIGFLLGGVVGIGTIVGVLLVGPTNRRHLTFS